MCGYSGFLFNSASIIANHSDSRERFLSAAAQLAHRGNEPMRTEFFPFLFVSHFRLAFQDISNNIQPMCSADNKWLILFNGEIYNFKILRQKMQSEFQIHFKTNGDTEVLLNGFLHYGHRILDLIEGEYSFVICRTDGSEIFAARDSFGVKPLFFFLEDITTDFFAVAKDKYFFKTKSLQFASEIKGLLSSKRWDKEGFLRQFVGLFEPIRTPFQNIIQLSPGSYLYGKKEGDFFSTQIHLKKEPVRRVATDPAVKPRDSSAGLSSRGAGLSSRGLTAGSTLETHFSQNLKTSVENRMLSEVELGVYLSGGIDSKAIAFELAELYKNKKTSSYKLKSFTLSFKEAEYDESKEALAFARKMNFDPHVLCVSNENLAYSYPHAVYHSENIQPYTNGAAKWWLSRFTSQYVHGVLTGDGADELLCGYPSFLYANCWKFALRNRPGKNVFDKIMKMPLGTNWRDHIYTQKFSSQNKNPWVSGSSAEGSGEDFIESLQIWGVPHPLFGQIKTIVTAVLGAEEAMQWLKKQRDSVSSWFSFGLTESENDLLDPENSLLLWQNYFCKTHLPVQVLNWVGDRMEMANTLEGRTPFLSREMRAFIQTLPDYMLVRGFENKSILRRAYRKKFAAEFAMTPKKQFGSPFLPVHNADKAGINSLLAKIKETGLLDKKLAAALFNNMNSILADKNISFHIKTHLQSTLQTLQCFAIVDDTIVKNNIPVRDLEYEKNCLAVSLLNQ